jgi:hypothetical protein
MEVELPQFLPPPDMERRSPQTGGPGVVTGIPSTMPDIIPSSLTPPPGAGDLDSPMPQSYALGLLVPTAQGMPSTVQKDVTPTPISMAPDMLPATPPLQPNNNPLHISDFDQDACSDPEGEAMEAEPIFTIGPSAIPPLLMTALAPPLSLVQICEEVASPTHPSSAQLLSQPSTPRPIMVIGGDSGWCSLRLSPSLVPLLLNPEMLQPCPQPRNRINCHDMSDEEQ